MKPAEPIESNQTEISQKTAEAWAEVYINIAEKLIAEENKKAVVSEELHPGNSTSESSNK